MKHLRMAEDVARFLGCMPVSDTVGRFLLQAVPQSDDCLVVEMMRDVPDVRLSFPVIEAAGCALWWRRVPRT
jgi:hypothetical protein